MQLEHGFEDAAVALAIKLVGLHDLDDGIDDVVLQQDAAEHGTLRLERVRWYS